MKTLRRWLSAVRAWWDGSEAGPPAAILAPFGVQYSCPFCYAEHVPSTVTTGPTFKTLMGFSAGGRDPNWYTTDYACSRGHSYKVRRREGDPDQIVRI